MQAGTHRAWVKPEHVIYYVHRESNHPAQCPRPTEHPHQGPEAPHPPLLQQHNVRGSQGPVLGRPSEGRLQPPASLQPYQPAIKEEEEGTQHPVVQSPLLKELQNQPWPPVLAAPRPLLPSWPPPTQGAELPHCPTIIRDNAQPRQAGGRPQYQGHHPRHQLWGAELQLQGQERSLHDGGEQVHAQVRGSDHQQQGRVLLRVPPQALTFTVIKTIFCSM